MHWITLFNAGVYPCIRKKDPSALGDSAGAFVIDADWRRAGDTGWRKRCPRLKAWLPQGWSPLNLGRKKVWHYLTALDDIPRVVRFV